MDLSILTAVWGLLLVGSISVAVYRRIVARQEDDMVHLHDTDRGLVTTQAAVAEKLETLDRMERVLIILTVAGGLVLALMYGWQFWQDSYKVPQ